MRNKIILIIFILVISTVQVFSDEYICCQAPNEQGYGQTTTESCLQYNGSVVETSYCDTSGNEQESIENTEIIQDEQSEDFTEVRQELSEQDIESHNEMTTFDKERMMKLCNENPGKCKEMKERMRNQNPDNYNERKLHLKESKLELLIIHKMMEGLNMQEMKEHKQKDEEQFCQNPLIEIEQVITKLKESNSWNLKKACDKIEQEHSNQQLGKCNDITEEQIKNVMIEQSKNVCSLSGKEQYKNIIEARKHLKGELAVETDTSVEEVAEAEEQTTEVLQDKSNFYKFKKFLGLAKKQELEESKILKESSSKLKNAIEVLKNVAEKTENEEVKTVLLQQVKDLEDRAEELETMSEKKEQKAKGIFSMFNSSEE